MTCMASRPTSVRQKLLAWKSQGVADGGKPGDRRASIIRFGTERRDDQIGRYGEEWDDRDRLAEAGVPA